MKRSLRTLLSALAVACAAMAPVAHASTLLDFEDPNLTGAYFSGEYFEEDGFRLTLFNGVGTVDTEASLGAAAPTNNDTQFFSSQNEGRVRLASVDGSTFNLDSFDVAFVPLFGSTAAPQTILIAVGYFYADGRASFSTFSLGNTSSTTAGSPFITFSGASLGARYTNLASATFFACSTTDGTNCSAQLMQNNGQFALDNVLVSAPVPEPTTAALMALGLLGLVLTRRRSIRRSSRGAL